MYDIHTHLYWHSYDTDRDEVLKRAREAGVEKMIVVGTSIEESRQATLLAEKYPELYASVGIHPHVFNESRVTSDELQREVEALRKLAHGSKKVVAIGECGLDYYSHNQQTTINNEQKLTQREGFLAQIELAIDLGLPLIVHGRTSNPTTDDAYRDLFETLSPITSDLKAVVLHCYMGDTGVTEEFLKLSNVYFSFTANITYPVKKEIQNTKYDIQNTVKLVPLDRLLVETDCPFLAPQEYRGKRNEPAWVGEVTKKISEIKVESLETVDKETRALADRIFVL